MRKVLSIIGIVLLAYIIIGNLAHYVIFPEDLPDIATYFQPGDRYISEWERLEQKVLRLEGDRLYVDLLIHPHSPGPPEHIHTGFEEVFEVTSGTLSFLLDGEKHILQSGESIIVPPGTPHKPFNETDSIVIVSGQNFSIPLNFAVYLSQVYGYFDADVDNEKMPGVLLQMSLFNQYFDSWLAQGPPIFVQKTAGFIIRPLARLAGYRSCYKEYTPQSNSTYLVRYIIAVLIVR